MIVNAGQVLTRLNRLRQVSHEIAKATLYGEATRLMDQSQALVPVATGELKNSAYVATPASTAQSASVELGYGAAHAAEVHEDLTVAHASGQAKFLETPLQQEGSIRSRLVHDLQRRIKAEDPSMPAGRYPTALRRG